MKKRIQSLNDYTNEQKLNESGKEFYADGVLVKVNDIKKSGKNYHIDAHFYFNDKKTLGWFMHNDLDNMTADILYWAEEEFGIDGADYSVNPDKMKTKGNELIGTLLIDFGG